MVLKNLSKQEKDKTTVYLVRHGETDLNKILERRKRGEKIPFVELGLNRKGVLQAKKLAKGLEKIKGEIDIVYCSDLKRAKETTGYVCKALLLKPRICKEFREYGAGDIFQGKFYTVKFWKRLWKYLISNKRFDEILIKHPGKTIVIIAHGNIIKGIIGKKKGLTFKEMGLLEQDNCCTSKLRFKGKKLENVDYVNSKIL